MLANVAKWPKKLAEHKRWLWRVPQGGVTGRYLIVQILSRRTYLLICEVEAGREIMLVFLLTMFFCWLFCLFRIIAVIDIKTLTKYILISVINHAYIPCMSNILDTAIWRYRVIWLFAAAALHFWNWTTLLPNSNITETTLPLVSDLLNETCVQIDLYGGDVHIRGQFTGSFKSLNVSLTMATSIAFSPGSNQATCHLMTSTLMTHQRSDCNQVYCAVPIGCSYRGHKAISVAPILWEYDFICVCGQAWCNELLLWLRSDSVQGQFNRVDLCEVDVGFVWFALQWH